MKTFIIIFTTLLFTGFESLSQAQNTAPATETASYPKSKVSFTDFENLMGEVKDVRSARLISFKQLQAFQAEPNTVLLDARSRDRFRERHLSGAVNLPYTDFTEDNLKKIVPDPNTRILIYCNNNFEGDEVSFAGKGLRLSSKDIKRLNSNTLYPKATPKKEIRKFERKQKKKNKKIEKSLKREPTEIMLALNVPTYVTLYGYGYRNIYELGELLDVNDRRITFNGNRVVRRLSAVPYPARIK